MEKIEKIFHPTRKIYVAKIIIYTIVFIPSLIFLVPIINNHITNFKNISNITILFISVMYLLFLIPQIINLIFNNYIYEYKITKDNIYTKIGFILSEETLIKKNKIKSIKIKKPNLLQFLTSCRTISIETDGVRGADIKLNNILNFKEFISN